MEYDVDGVEITVVGEVWVTPPLAPTHALRAWAAGAGVAGAWWPQALEEVATEVEVSQGRVDISRLDLADLLSEVWRRFRARQATHADALRRIDAVLPAPRWPDAANARLPVPLIWETSVAVRLRVGCDGWRVELFGDHPERLAAIEAVVYEDGGPTPSARTSGPYRTCRPRPVALAEALALGEVSLAELEPAQLAEAMLGGWVPAERSAEAWHLVARAAAEMPTGTRRQLWASASSPTVAAPDAAVVAADALAEALGEVPSAEVLRRVHAHGAIAPWDAGWHDTSSCCPEPGGLEDCSVLIGHQLGAVWSAFVARRVIGAPTATSAPAGHWLRLTPFLLSERGMLKFIRATRAAGAGGFVRLDGSVDIEALVEAAPLILDGILAHR